jgi:hypothetical protein
MDPQTAEAGETYLNGLGFRSLIEWVTAEVLLSRPEDPLAFIRSILDEKLAEVTERKQIMRLVSIWEGLTNTLV